MAAHTTRAGLIELRARIRWDKYREHTFDEHFHTGCELPEWDELPYIERIILLKTETDMYEEYKVNREDR